MKVPARELMVRRKTKATGSHGKVVGEGEGEMIGVMGLDVGSAIDLLPLNACVATFRLAVQR